MKLYSYQHCPFCLRVKMILSLMEIPFEDIILSNDDEKTPIQMIGVKQLPILEKDNGEYLFESLVIVKYLNELYLDRAIIQNTQNQTTKEWEESVNNDIKNWVNDVSTCLYKLCFPRLVQLDFDEFSTPESRNYFTEKKEKSLGMTFKEVLLQTEELKQEAEYYIKALSPFITKLPSVSKRDFSINDIIIVPILFLLTSVKGLKWDKNVQDYLKHISTIAKMPLFKGV